MNFYEILKLFICEYYRIYIFFNLEINLKNMKNILTLRHCVTEAAFVESFSFIKCFVSSSLLNGLNYIYIFFICCEEVLYLPSFIHGIDVTIN